MPSRIIKGDLLFRFVGTDIHHREMYEVQRKLDYVGSVTWSPRHKQYVFYPMSDVKHNAGALRTLADFMDALK